MRGPRQHRLVQGGERVEAFVEHGRGGCGEPVAGLLRAGNAGSATAVDHIAAAQLALTRCRKSTGAGVSR